MKKLKARALKQQSTLIKLSGYLLVASLILMML
ncbi:hypothetical protein AQULUS_12850 [Aquicella lusitana]|uniref:Uncharacterized protein n=1 Tax=Aquicella lusitana TaxID=254246 RepID=A0A370GHY1_9COXI|nr:hypothetical protein C8D86_11148 [Aquicella lusitana]VVC73542.1 hypothetical protein AQULUS_12850 [Aquicella lusitana]